MVIDWTKIYKKYKGLWVALKKDQKTVVASDKTARGALKKAEKKGLDDPILFRVPTKILPYIGSFGL
jgi:hypothetical protein